MYTARVAALAVMQQREQISCAAASSALLNVLISEASREYPGAAAGGTDASDVSGKKRKASTSGIAAVYAMLGGMGSSAEPLAALTTWLKAKNSSSSLVFEDNSNNNTNATGKKASKKAKKEVAEVASSGNNIDTSMNALLSSLLFPDIVDSTTTIKPLASVPLSQLSLAVFYLGQTAEFGSGEKIFDQVSALLESDAALQRAPLVIRQALHLFSTCDFLSKDQSLCAVLRGAIGATLKHPSSSLGQTASCISLVCSSESLLKALESSEFEGVLVELWEWLLEKVIASSSLIASLRPVVAKIITNASETISKRKNLKNPPSATISKLLPLAVAAQIADTSSLLCSLLEVISKNIKTVDAQWITIAGIATAKLISAPASKETVESLLQAGCRAVADLFAAQRSR
jgi:hypothetical protein